MAQSKSSGQPPRPASKSKTKAVGKRVGKSKPAKAKNQLNRRVK
ncbi:hypothetical protein [Bacteroides propionicifaciens]|nr:hypothetical protein [Bacteroides propionicifaciens]